MTMKSNKIMAMVGAMLCMASFALWGAQPSVKGDYDFIMQFRLFDGDRKELCKVKHWELGETTSCAWSGKPAEALELFAGTDDRAYGFGRVCGNKPTGESLFCLFFDLTGGGYGDEGFVTLREQHESHSMVFYGFLPSPYVSPVELTYEPGKIFVKLYSSQNMQGEHLCTVEVGVDDSKPTCNDSGARAHSAKIIGLPKNRKVCFRAVKDEANRCYEPSSSLAGVYAISIPDLNSTDVPGAKVTSKGDVLATKLYSIDMLQ